MPGVPGRQCRVCPGGNAGRARAAMPVNEEMAMPPPHKCRPGRPSIPPIGRTTTAHITITSYKCNLSEEQQTSVEISNLQSLDVILDNCHSQLYNIPPSCWLILATLSICKNLGRIKRVATGDVAPPKRGHWELDYVGRKSPRQKHAGHTYERANRSVACDGRKGLKFIFFNSRCFGQSDVTWRLLRLTFI